MQATTRWMEYMEVQAMLHKNDNPHLAGDLPETIRLFVRHCIKDKKDGVSAAKLERRQLKRNYDNDQLEGMPSAEELLEACSKSMTYLEVLLDFISMDAPENRDWNYCKLATELMVGLIFLNTLAGTLYVNHGYPF